jgi:hypothetical protein
MEDEQAEPGAGSVPCDDPAVPNDGQPAATEDPAVEARADEVFRPGDEISEDYPVPLPSDI